MTRLYTSDLHFGHAKVIEFSGRGHNSVGDMNSDIVERWNTIVHPGDGVLVLGDVCLGKLDQSLGYIKHLNGTITLLPGNHDRMWHANAEQDKIDKWECKYRDAGFDHILTDAYDLVRGKVGDHEVLFCHFPYEGDHTEEDRYEIHRPHDDGHTWLIHGHVHEAWRQSGRMINVGIDAWGGYPVTEQQIVDLIEAGPNDLDRIDW